ncbi:MAG: DNA-directed RNA polymerase subunit B [Candidatus Norongarragalinales archaeon]
MKHAGVFVDGKFVGFAENGEKLARELREMRRAGDVHSQINIAFYAKTNEVFINTDEGRVRRPLIVVKNGKPLLSKEQADKLEKGELHWKNLVEQGLIEFLDAEEEENAFVALKPEDVTPDHTHLEIDHSMILGFASSQLPYPEYNMAPRVLMSAQHAKQSLGLYASNFNLRSDTRAHVLFYPQQPLLQTSAYRNLRLNKRASGQNLVVAVLSYKGFNMNDAVVLNKTSVERGIGRSAFIRTYGAVERRYPGGQKDSFGIPEEYVQGFLGEEAYAHLDEDGFAAPETVVKGNAVLVGKSSPPRFLKEISALEMESERRRESSVTVRGNEEGTVDAVILSETTSGNKMVKIRVRNTNIPEVGDKFASRHGQKGVVSILVPQEDMPATKDGITPDLIINPHAIPGRMTAGHLLEMLGGKASALKGSIGDATAFSGDKQADFEKVLLQNGFEAAGQEVLYDGKTGERLYAKIFMGVIYYQRLHHLVSLKMHARSRGPVQMLTHQPTEGRAREGGLRLGEMERDCFIGYGAASLLKERMMDSSDKTVELVCANCGSLAYTDRQKNKSYCALCESSDIQPVEMSYAFKLLLDEMKSIGIFPKLRLGDRA